MKKAFDVVVVGTGTSAYYCVSELLKAGKADPALKKSIAVVDERAYGGTCGLRGCQPKKYLIANAEAVAGVKHLLGKGFDAAPKTNWAAVQALKNQFLDGHSQGAEDGFEKDGVAVFHGKAVFESSTALRVLANSSPEEPKKALAEDAVLEAGNIVLATGASTRLTTLPGSDVVKTSDDFLSLPALPRRILFVGGGFISFEFATVAALCGAESVTLLHRSDRPLKQFDKDMVDVVVAAMREHGVDICLSEEPTAYETLASGAVKVSLKSGKSLEVDAVFEGTGRTPNVGVVGADDKGGVKASAGRGIAVDKNLRSETNPRVFAIGDCAASGGPQLAPIGDEEGKIAAHNILHASVDATAKPSEPRATDYAVVPSCVFTIPPLATVGLDEEAATKAGLKFAVKKGNTLGYPSSKRIGETHSGYKVLVEEGTGKLLGAHLVRHNASENINLFALAMKHGLPASALNELPWAYPTYTSDCKYFVR